LSELEKMKSAKEMIEKTVIKDINEYRKNESSFGSLFGE
jgi:hypothetical protein